jgi:periplasmic divalent cation tolerance protein
MIESKNFSIVICNTSNIENSKSIANELVKLKLAACVNIIPKVHSIYEWEGKIVEEDESTMIIKTTELLLNKVEDVILENHSYDTPEIIKLSVDKSNKEYYNWLTEVLSK